MNVYPQGDLDEALGGVAALHAAGVDILTGTDVSGPDPAFGGMAHGASAHHELQLLVTAGLTPVRALRAATAMPARRFGLTDRGRIAPGARADCCWSTAIPPPPSPTRCPSAQSGAAASADTPP